MSDPIFAHLVDTGFDCEAADEKHVHELRGQFTTAQAAREYMRAGKATVTLVSKKTGNRFTYRVVTPTDRTTGEPANDGTLMVSVLTNPDNVRGYTWLGRISREIFFVGRKNPRAGEISRDAPSARAFDWTWRMLLRDMLPSDLEVWHEGRCGRCGRKLTVPQSVSRGFGPECAEKVGML